MTPNRPYLAAAMASAVAVLFLAACASAPPGPGVAEMGGSYSGNISIQGQTLFGSMTVAQEGPALTLQFSFPDVALTASGEGTATETGFSAEVPYTITCPGVAVFEGSLEEDGRTVSGTLRATDCDGASNGTFRFSRR